MFSNSPNGTSLSFFSLLGLFHYNVYMNVYIDYNVGGFLL